MDKLMIGIFIGIVVEFVIYLISSSSAKFP